ncbi:MAG: SANT/Myb-like DNA-binding domain-containing protein [Hafnia sp.]
MALLPGRTRGTIQWMAGKLGVVSARSWTPEEEQILATGYPALGTEVAGQLPGRTPEAVKIKACDMGIKYLGSEYAGQQMWSQEEQICLARNDHLVFADLLKLFPHRSWLSVKKARERLRRKKKKMVFQSVSC